ncbi:MAG: hypothetical protein HGA19_20740, partial [Oscillochloris sp.]|nr:hypothetical protein [Oscillochloris sp.]
MQEIDDLLVRVQRKQPCAGSTTYSVEMWLEGGRRIHAQEDLQINDYIEPQLRDTKSLAVHGLDLFNRLFSGRLAMAFQQAWVSAVVRDRLLRVRLALDPTAPQIHAIPWELLHFDDSGGISPPRPITVDGRIIFSRYIESADFAEGVQVSHRPVRMLIVISDPIDLSARWGLTPIERTSEERDFQSRFSPVISSGQFCYDLLPIASPEALQDAIICGGIGDEQPQGYDVLLFMGHAAYHQRYGPRLFLEHPETRHVWLYPTDELVSLVQQLPESHRPTMVA